MRAPEHRIETPDGPVVIRRSDRARRVRVTVLPDGTAQITLPRRAARRVADDALVQLAPWIARRRAAVARDRATVQARGETVPYLGTVLDLRRETGRTRVHRRGDVLHVPAADTHAALERWYRAAARREAAPRLARAADALGVTVAKLTIRNQKSRWGSCSGSGTISLNWRLLLAPDAVFDYVIWHEACHLVHHDHSPAFWALLARCVPDHAVHQRWLAAHGGTLVLSAA